MAVTASASSDLGKFKNTFYYYVDEAKYPEDRFPKTEKIFNPEGATLAKVSSAFKKAMDIEGSGKLIEGRMLNYAGKVDGQYYYRFTVHDYGRGIGNCPLVPFHTIAVDPTVVRIGSLVRIAETVGMKLPDGSIHDGLWRAEDIGGAIKGNRIDLFVGGDSKGATLDRQGITHMQPLTLELVQKPSKDSCIYQNPL